jgi:uncharacterized SAM-binding protein YcdF (DUF218 family)
LKVPRRLAYGFLLVIAACFVLVLLNYKSVLIAVGNYLVESSNPENSDAVIVLAGDNRGARIMRAAELVRAGYAPIALVSGPMEIYGVNEADLAIQFAVRRRVPAEYFQPVYRTALSTREEARGFAIEFRERNIRKVLLVTSDYHSRRAVSIFRGVIGPQVVIKSVPAPDRYFQAGTWWQNREGQKTVFYEYSKTVAGWLGM